MKNFQKGFIAPLVIFVTIVFGIGLFIYSKNNSVIKHADQSSVAVINDTVKPVISTTTVEPILPPVSEKIICAGGVPCTNPGAIKVFTYDGVWAVGNTYRVSWTNSLPLNNDSYYYITLGNGTSTKWTVSGGMSGSWQIDSTKKFVDVPITESLVAFAVSQADRNQQFSNIKDTFFFRVLELDKKGTEMSRDDVSIAAADSPYFSITDYRGYGTKQYCIDKNYQKCPWNQ